MLVYGKTCVIQPLSKRLRIGFHDHLSLNAGQKYCRVLQEEHSAILSTFIKLPLVIKIFLSIFVRPFYSGFTVYKYMKWLMRVWFLHIPIYSRAICVNFNMSLHLHPTLEYVCAMV